MRQIKSLSMILASNCPGKSFVTSPLPNEPASATAGAESATGFPVDLCQFRQCCPNVWLCPPQKAVPRLQRHLEMAQTGAGRVSNRPAVAVGSGNGADGAVRRGSTPHGVGGSHLNRRATFADLFRDHAPRHWPDIDVAADCQEARRTALETCRRIEPPSSPGEAVLLHRHLLHGLTPWAEGVEGSPDGRMLTYFRPEFPRLADWLSAP